MTTKNILIDWKYSGTPDGFFGTGSTTMEQGIVWLFGCAGAMLLGWVWWTNSISWTWWQYAIAALIALDVLGGVVANSLNSCKRFYHSPLQSEETGFTAFAKNHFMFTALHIHPVLIGLLFGNFNWTYGLFWYAILLLSAVVILRIPLYLQRPASMGIIMLAALFNFYIIPPVSGFEWLVPALFLKIVYGHLVHEEPYRP
ncbi:MAG: hypothetical protein JNM55_22275 [Anaerolineales bacterium]|nr:hypothetical protein [Anaerolineales bacterium]